MAELIVNTSRIAQNVEKLNKLLGKTGVKWSLITKVLSGNKAVLEKILNRDSIEHVHSIGDSRLSSLKVIKEISPDIRTMYIKPPALRYAESIIQYADISLNTSFTTIKYLNEVAGRMGKIHEIIIMIELGELREGVIRENLMDFYRKVFSLDHIKVIGIGTNLGCMYGIIPTYDKLLQLCLYKQLIEAKFDVKIDLISGGSSITLPLLTMKKLPKAVNHFRIGEAVFLGTSPFDNEKFRDLSTKAFDFNANIIELEEKETQPDGIISDASIGHTADEQEEPEENSKHDPLPKSYRAILDFGLLDVDTDGISAKDPSINYIGTTSDMTVVDVATEEINGQLIPKYKIGGKVHFDLNYMAVARLMSSRFIEKKVL